MTIEELKKIKKEMSLELIKLPPGEIVTLSKKWKEEWILEKQKRNKDRNINAKKTVKV